MITPQRLTKRRAHLDASAVVVERALLARAEALKQLAASDAVLATDPAEAAVMARISTEFRELAETLHWYG